MGPSDTPSSATCLYDAPVSLSHPLLREIIQQLSAEQVSALFGASSLTQDAMMEHLLSQAEKFGCDVHELRVYLSDAGSAQFVTFRGENAEDRILDLCRPELMKEDPLTFSVRTSLARALEEGFEELHDLDALRGEGIPPHLGYILDQITIAGGQLTIGGRIRSMLGGSPIPLRFTFPLRDHLEVNGGDELTFQ
ncbi:MAG: hypothetical protein WC777_05150 [Candidatus Gracilibacteria bacterium]|jgi:hypothetical protein